MRRARSVPGFTRLNRDYLVARLTEFELRKLRYRNVAGPPAEIIEDALLHLLQAPPQTGALQPQDLVELNQVLTASSDPPLRRHAGRPVCPGYQPLDPKAIGRALDRLFLWLHSPSFDQLHAVEKMTLAQLRLYEMEPFESASETTASLFAVRLLPPDQNLLPLYDPATAEDFFQALCSAFQLATEGLVHYNLQACQRAYDELDRLSLA